MANIITIQGTDTLKNSRPTINNNFNALNTDIIALSALGVSGYSGFSGIGTSGYSGTNGSSGYSGTNGSSGYSGTNGSSGYSGTNGSSGYSGSSGNIGISGFSGYSGAQGNNGNAGASGFSGYSGSQGPAGPAGNFIAKDWLYFNATGGSVVPANSIYTLSGTVLSAGAISYNSANGYVTLAANKTYNLRAALALANNVSSGEIDYQWINVTNGNTNIGNAGGVLAVNLVASANWQPTAEAVVTTTTQTQVALKSTFSGASALNLSFCYFIVEQIDTAGSYYSGTSGYSGFSGTNGTTGSNGASGYSGFSGTNGTIGSNGASGYSGLSYPSTTGSWTLSSGANTVSFTVPNGYTYSMWVNGNIPNGICVWNATATVTNTNVPVIGVQYAWYYLTGNALVLTSIPTQIIGTAGTISTSSPAVANTNVFTFDITNNSGASRVINWGYTRL